MIEKLFYEVKPYACLGIAIYALGVIGINSMFGKSAALVLLIIGTILVYTRLKSRGLIKW